MILRNGMKLYHGTDALFSEIKIEGHSSPFRDFGEGFYLTSFFAQAKAQARRKARRMLRAERTIPAYVYKYEVRRFDRNNYRILELLQYDKDWVDFLKYNRVFGGRVSPAPTMSADSAVPADSADSNAEAPITPVATITLPLQIPPTTSITLDSAILHSSCPVAPMVIPPKWLDLDIVYDRMADNVRNIIDEDLRRYSKN